MPCYMGPPHDGMERPRGYGWRRWSPDMEASCEYIEYAVMESRQGVVLQLDC